MPAAQNKKPVSFRAFTSADAPQMAKIYAHYVENTLVTFDLEAPKESFLIEKFNTMLGAGHPVIIAHQGDRIVGFAYASTYRPRPAYRFTCENSVYLDPDSTGYGLGSALMTRLIAQSKACGFNQMVAIITAHSAASIALHTKFGFEIKGKFPELGWKFDTWHDVIHMQLKL